MPMLAKFNAAINADAGEIPVQQLSLTQRCAKEKQKREYKEITVFVMEFASSFFPASELSFHSQKLLLHMEVSRRTRVPK